MTTLSTCKALYTSSQLLGATPFNASLQRQLEKHVLLHDVGTLTSPILTSPPTHSTSTNLCRSACSVEALFRDSKTLTPAQVSTCLTCIQAHATTPSRDTWGCALCEKVVAPLAYKEASALAGFDATNPHQTYAMPTASSIQAELEKSAVDKAQLTQTFQSLPTCIQAEVMDKVCLQADRFVLSMEGADPTKGSDSSDIDWAYMGTILGYVVGALIFAVIILFILFKLGYRKGQADTSNTAYIKSPHYIMNIPVYIYNYGVMLGQKKSGLP